MAATRYRPIEMYEHFTEGMGSEQGCQAFADGFAGVFASEADFLATGPVEVGVTYAYYPLRACEYYPECVAVLKRQPK